MTWFQALVITASFSVPLVVGLFLLVVNYFDNRAAARQLTQKQAAALRQATSPAVSFSDLSEAEREQLRLHVETLEAFAETVRNASAIVEETTRRVNTTAADHRAMENEKR
jgi:hypothetical protein